MFTADYLVAIHLNRNKQRQSLGLDMVKRKEGKEVGMKQKTINALKIFSSTECY